MFLSGFLYLFILVLQIAMAAFGYILEPTPKHYESDSKLLNFNNNPFQRRYTSYNIVYCF